MRDVEPARTPGTTLPFESLLNALSRALLTKHSLRYELAFGIAAVLVATLSREFLNEFLPSGFPFLTFFPAVMLSLIFASVRCGIVVAIVCGLISWVWYIPPYGSLALQQGALLAIGFYVLITATDILFVTAAARALRALATAREESARLAQVRELMFSELQHRVSNNLATAAALLRLQSTQIEDPAARQALTAAQLRIQSISRLQRRLHAPDAQALDGGEYLRGILDDTLEAANLGHRAHVQVRTDPLPLENDDAVPLGLIAGELMMNALEHGAKADEAARIEVKLTAGKPQEDGMIPVRLTLRDTGPGLPEGFRLDQCTSLGLTIATQFASAMDGTLTMENAPGGGTLAVLEFRVHPATSAVPPPSAGPRRAITIPPGGDVPDMHKAGLAGSGTGRKETGGNGPARPSGATRQNSAP